MHMDPLLPQLTLVLAVLLALAWLSRRLNQPSPVVYLIAGLLVGPEVLDVIPDQEALHRAGEFGVLLLLFFLGTEIKLPALLKDWRLPVIGTALQIGLSVLVAAAVGTAFDWSTPRIVLLGFVISLSSTALVLPLLDARSERDTAIGQDVVSVLLAQDLAVAPMLVVLALLSGHSPSSGEVALQLGGAVALLGLVLFVGLRGRIQLPGMGQLAKDREYQVFGALLLAMLLATFSGWMGLSTAFGAFVGGLVVGASDDSDWVHHSLDPLRVLLVAVFLMAIGAMVQLDFFWAHATEVTLLALAALGVNTVVNALALRANGRTWRNALYGGGLLAQIGEFSFVLAAVGAESSIITDQGYQMALSVIAMTLVMGSLWVSAVSRLTGHATPR